MITKSIRKEKSVFPLHNVVVVDGDTIKAKIILPFEQSIEQRIRLKGWWADEPTGLYAASGLAAHSKLQAFCAGKVLWLWSKGERRDKYGRIIGHLIHEERLVNPKDVLGEHQLSQKVHQLHREQSKNARSGPQGAASLPAGAGTPDALKNAPRPILGRGAGIVFYKDGGVEELRDDQVW